MVVKCSKDCHCVQSFYIQVKKLLCNHRVQQMYELCHHTMIGMKEKVWNEMWFVILYFIENQIFTVLTVAERTVPNSSVSDHMSFTNTAPCSLALWSGNAILKNKSLSIGFNRRKKNFFFPLCLHFSNITNLYNDIQFFNFEANVFHAIAMFYQVISNKCIIWIVSRHEHENNLKMLSKNVLFSLSARNKLDSMGLCRSEFELKTEYQLMFCLFLNWQNLN